MEINDQFPNETAEEFDDNSEKREREYDRIIQLFEADMKKQGLSLQTTRKHGDHVFIFLGEYVAYRHEMNLLNSIDFIDEYFCDYFIRKVARTKVERIKAHATSLKKFYKWLSEQDVITRESYKAFFDNYTSRIQNWEKIYHSFASGEPRIIFS